MAELTATAPRARRHLGALGVCVGAALGLLLISFASGGYFPTAWTWGALLALVFVAAALVLGNVVRPSRLALVSLGGLTGFGVWTWLALLWSSNPAATVLEGLRVLFYVAVLAGLIAVLRRAYVPLLLAATLTAIVLASGYGLLTRLFPERLGVFDPVAAYRLEEPLTYWNALGVFAAMGALLALGFAARSQTVIARALPAATLPILLSTLYFTFSRGGWIAGAVGLAVAVAVDPRRLQLLVNAVVLAVPSAIAVLISSHEKALTRLDTPLAAASHDGHRLAVWIVLLAVLSGLAAAGLWFAERRVAPPRTLRLAFAGAVSAVALVAVLAVFVRYGGPVELVRKGYDSFTTTTNEPTPNLNQRLFSFSGSHRSELWHAAWHDYESHPVLGSGPGTYEEYWNQHRTIQHKVRDAHSLYLEVLAELGPLGLLLLVLALGAPVVAAVRARASPARPAHARGLRRLPRPRRRGLGLGDAGGHARSPHVRGRRSSPAPTTATRRSSRRERAQPARSRRSCSHSSPSSASSARARSQRASASWPRAATPTRPPRRGRPPAGGAGRRSRGSSSETSPTSGETTPPPAATT